MSVREAPLRIIDGHVHFVHPERMDQILALMDAVPCARFNLVCLPNPDGTSQNAAALYFKEHHPDRVYLSGALAYGPALADPDAAPAALAAQALLLRAQGFDGLKLIEGKPQVRKLLPHPLDGPLYAQLWATLEEAQFPVVLHVADPDEFWDAQRCPDWARRSGWDYSDGSYPSKEALYAEMDRVLARHPRLKLVLAHFYFLSRELERAAGFLEAHPSVCVDLAPHMDMYQDFSRDPVAVRAFFLRHQTRIIYGTDTDTRALARGAEGLDLMRFIPRLIRAFLEQEGALDLPGTHRYHGLGLPREALDNIYHANFERVYGSAQNP
jgi:predicted TIM-barrel fold metal-dependent hydrolase